MDRNLKVKLQGFSSRLYALERREVGRLRDARTVAIAGVLVAAAVGALAGVVGAWVVG